MQISKEKLKMHSKTFKGKKSLISVKKSLQ